MSGLIRWRPATEGPIDRTEIATVSTDIAALSARVSLLESAVGVDDTATRATVGAATSAAAPATLVRRDALGLTHVYVPFADVLRTTNQDIPNTTYAAISWASSPAQRGPMWSGANPTRLTNPLPLTMRFLITAHIAFGGNASGERYVTITKNGGSNAIARNKHLGGVFTEVTIATYVTLAAYEYCEVVVYQDSGSTIPVMYFADWTPVASIEMSMAQPTTVRLHEIGDSITYGSGAIPATVINGGYRLLLYNNGVAAGKVLETVGTQSGNSAGMVYYKHDGWSGYAINSILSLITGGYFDGVYADVILLNIGANDIKNNDDLTNFGARYAALVTAILTKWTSVRLICATIGPYASPWGGDGSGYNMMLYQPTANAYISALPTTHPMGNRILIADLAASLTTGNLPDGLHPNAAGYQQMADAWWAVLQTIIYKHKRHWFGSDS